jgi:hypothetical protein
MPPPTVLLKAYYVDFPSIVRVQETPEFRRDCKYGAAVLLPFGGTSSFLKIATTIFKTK